MATPSGFRRMTDFYGDPTSREKVFISTRVLYAPSDTSFALPSRNTVVGGTGTIKDVTSEGEVYIPSASVSISVTGDVTPGSDKKIDDAVLGEVFGKSIDSVLGDLWGPKTSNVAADNKRTLSLFGSLYYNPETSESFRTSFNVSEYGKGDQLIQRLTVSVSGQLMGKTPKSKPEDPEPIGKSVGFSVSVSGIVKAGQKVNQKLVVDDNEALRILEYFKGMLLKTADLAPKGASSDATRYADSKGRVIYLDENLPAPAELPVLP